MTSLFLITFGLMLFTTPILVRMAESDDEPLVWLAYQDRDRQRLLVGLSLSGLIMFVLGVALP